MTAIVARRYRQFVKLLRLLPRAEWRRGLRHGVAAAIEHYGAIGELRPATVVDVGANIGQFSLLAAALWPRARIIAFEPLPEAAERFARLFADSDRVTLHNTALGAGAGSAALHISARPDSSSLRPISATQSRLFPGTHEVGTLTVPVGRLPDFVSREALGAPALLKIDVQGTELDVLRGAADLLDEFDWLYVEASWLPLYEGQSLADDVTAYLETKGFVVADLFNQVTGPDGALVQADFLFRRGAAC